MTVVREERKDLLAEIAKRAGERRAQVQNILERYAKEKDQQPPSPGPAVTPASPKTFSTPSPAGSAAAARMAPAPVAIGAAASTAVRAPSAPTAMASGQGVGGRVIERGGDRALEQIERLDRRVEVAERRLEDGSKRMEEAGQKQAESIRVLEQSVRRSEAMAKLIEEVARRTERLEARVADIELRPEPAPAIPEDGILAVLESRMAELDQQGAQLEGLTESVRQMESFSQDRSEQLSSLEERIRAFERLTERMDSIERTVLHQAAQEQRFHALEDAIARLTNQIDHFSRPAAPARVDLWPSADAAARIEASARPETTLAIPAAVPAGHQPLAGHQPKLEMAEPPASRAMPPNPTPISASEANVRSTPGDATAQVRAEDSEVRPTLAAKTPVRERDQDKLKGVLDTLARLTAELHEMSEQRRFTAGA